MCRLFAGLTVLQWEIMLVIRQHIAEVASIHYDVGPQRSDQQILFFPAGNTKQRQMETL